jgi:hypothetical protein
MKCKKKNDSQIWWYIPIIPALRMLRQEEKEFEAGLGLAT